MVKDQGLLKQFPVEPNSIKRLQKDTIAKSHQKMTSSNQLSKKKKLLEMPQKK